MFYFLFFQDSENKAWGPVKNLPWLYQESVIALGGVRHGSLRNPSWLWEKSVTSGDWPVKAKDSLQR